MLFGRYIIGMLMITMTYSVETAYCALLFPKFCHTFENPSYNYYYKIIE